MDRALDPDYIAGAFGNAPLSELPTVEELIDLIAELEIELVRGLTDSSFRTELSPLLRTAWYLHGIASTPESHRYPLEQRRRAFAVSAHVLDLILEDSVETGRDRMATAFAAQVGYHRADESPNAGAIYRKMQSTMSVPPEFTESADVALHAGVLFLGLDMTRLSRQLYSWSGFASELMRSAQLHDLDGTMFGSTQRLLEGVAGLVGYLREGSSDDFEAARRHLLRVVRCEVGPSDIDTRWVAGHLLRMADELGESSVWAVLPPNLPAAVKQAFTLVSQPVLTLWPPQKSLLAHPEMSPLNQQTSRLLVSVPTSAGKTLLAQLIICAHAAQGDGDVCYVTPLRSLGREVRQDLRQRLSFLGQRLGADLPDGLGTQDLDAADLEESDGVSDELAQVEVMTPERLMNALRQNPQEVLDRFSLFIIDEAHLISQSGGRGFLLEGLLTILDASGARLMLFSGVIGNAASLAAWTSAGRGEVLFTDAWRAPRRLHILSGTEVIDKSQTIIPGKRGAPEKTRYNLRASLAIRPNGAKIQHLVTSGDAPIGQLVVGADSKSISGGNNTTPKYVTTARMATLLLGAGSLLMVVSKRSIARDAAKVMAAEMEDDPRSQGLADALAARLGTTHPLVGCVRKGVAYHHAGLPVEAQAAVEDAIRNEQIKAVVATSTLTDGVNLPVRTVVIATTEYAGQNPGQRMSPAQLLNAVGRAGRAGKESEGWVVLALHKALRDNDFERLTPSASELEVRSSLNDETALAALGEAEELIAQTHDAILRMHAGSAPDGFVNYVWFVLHAFDRVPELANGRQWRDIVTRLFAFTQMSEDSKERWLRIAEAVADQYEQTPLVSRRRWAQAGTSLGSAAIIERIAIELADHVQLLHGPDELTLIETLDLFAELDVYSKLLELPERGKCWKFRVSPQGGLIEISTSAVVRDWIEGRELNELAETHLAEVKDSAFGLEQMVDAIGEGMQHYFSWTVGLIIDQTNEILQSRSCSAQLCNRTSAHFRYGVDTNLAINLLTRDVKSRRLARDIGKLAKDRGLDNKGIRAYLREQHIRGWRDNLGATPTDVLDLLQYVQGSDQHKLREIMDTGSAKAGVNFVDSFTEVGPESQPVQVEVSAEIDGSEIHVLSRDRSILGVIVASDHADVAAALKSGLSLNFTLNNSTLTISRSAKGQLSLIGS